MASYSSHGLEHKPRTVQQITKDAGDYDYDALVPLSRWLRTANTILKQAAVYEREGNDELTYLLLFRHAHLILTNLPVHPEAQKAIYKGQIEEARNEVKANLAKLEVLKPRITRRYERYKEIQADREARKAVRQPAVEEPRLSSPHINVPAAGAQTLEPREHGDLVVKLAQKEARRLARRREADPDIRQREAHQRSHGVWDQWRGPAYDPTADADDDLQRHLQEVRARVDEQHIAKPIQPIYDKPRSSYNYPSVPSKSALIDGTKDLKNQPEEVSENISPPALPPKQSLSHDFESVQHLPTIPSKALLTTPTPPLPSKISTPPPTDPSSYTFKAAAMTESGRPLRTVFLPPNLRRTFLKIAHPNTLRDLETCGILAGSLTSNALFINHLIIPGQTSTANTCEMEDEEALSDFIAEQDLIMLGWIHTHPSQTCFMSSLDIHTQAQYQISLPELIAIVCSPNQHDQPNSDDLGTWGCFRLTDPPGLKHILGCRREGVFHPHDVQNIYTGALGRPGHVIEAPKELEFRVVDLRGGGGGGHGGS